MARIRLSELLLVINMALLDRAIRTLLTIRRMEYLVPIIARYVSVRLILRTFLLSSSLTRLEDEVAGLNVASAILVRRYLRLVLIDVTCLSSGA